MAKDWDYAKMAQEASASGGPEAWIETIKRSAYNSGASDMKNRLVVPLMLAGVGIGSIGVVGYQKIHKWISEKRNEKLLTEKEAAEAEEFLKKELEDVLEEYKNSEDTQEGEE